MSGAQISSPTETTFQQNVAVESRPEVQQTQAEISNRALWLGLACIGVATFFCYKSVLFNWVSGDDFVALDWLRRAFESPELILRNFYSTWLDVRTTRFYRPFYGISLAADYLVWGKHFLGFHITNLLLHLTNAALVFGIATELNKSNSNQKLSSQRLWPLAAAALFALYPLHSEVVAWVTGRVDSIVTVFYLITLWCYMRWRNGGEKQWLTASLAGCAAALGSKEIAVTIPAALVLYEFFVRTDSKSSPSSFATKQFSPSAVAQTVGRAIAVSVPFWCLLLGYFIVRRLALGTFIGGYDDTLYVSDLAEWNDKIWHSLMIITQPINTEIVRPGNLFARLLHCFWFTLPVFVILQVGENKLSLRLFAFLASWFVICLLPVLRILTLTGSLEGSRYGYLPSVAICLFVSLAVCGSSPVKTKWRIWFSTAGNVVLTMLLVSFAVLLSKNNSTWATAGTSAQSIRAGFDTILKGVENQQPTFVFGLPDNVNGAVIARNALWGLTGFSNAPIYDPDADGLVPLPFLKELIGADLQHARVYQWIPSEKTFKHFERLRLVNPVKQQFQGTQLRDLIVTNEPVAWSENSVNVHRDSCATLALKVSGKPCWGVEAIVVSYKVGNNQTAKEMFADLHFTTDACANRTITAHGIESSTDPAIGTLVFPLKEDAYWLFGDTCRSLSVTFPPDANISVSSIKLCPSSSVMPTISCSATTNLKSAGTVPLTSERSLLTSIDASQIENAATCVLEVSKPWTSFDHNRLASRSNTSFEITGLPLVSRVRLERKQFPAAGNYAVRVRALDRRGQAVGVPGDHMVIMAI